jgi:hypothetical protein
LLALAIGCVASRLGVATLAICGAAGAVAIEMRGVALVLLGALLVLAGGAFAIVVSRHLS